MYTKLKAYELFIATKFCAAVIRFKYRASSRDPPDLKDVQEMVAQAFQGMVIYYQEPAAFISRGRICHHNESKSLSPQCLCSRPTPAKAIPTPEIDGAQLPNLHGIWSGHLLLLQGHGFEVRKCASLGCEQC